MGFGYSAAIGTQDRRAQREVIHITGDGSFHMNMNEACTAVSNHLQVITVIMDNRVLGMVRQWQSLFYDSHYMCTEPERKSDYVKLAEGFRSPWLPRTTDFRFCLPWRTAFTARLDRHRHGCRRCPRSGNQALVSGSPLTDQRSWSPARSISVFSRQSSSECSTPS